MGLFGFNAEKKLAKGQEHLAKGQFYEARNAFEEILMKEGTVETIRSAAKEGWRRARKAMMDLQLEEADRHTVAGEIESAAESLRTAIEIAADDLDSAAARASLARLEMTAEATSGLSRTLEPPAQETEEDPIEVAGEDEPYLRVHADEIFEVYLQTLSEEEAEIYRSLGLEFRQAYLALQEGRVEDAIRSFEAAPAETAAHPYFRLERAQALLLLHMDERAYEELETIDLPATQRRIAEMKTILLGRLQRSEEAREIARGVWESNQDVDSAILYGEQLLAVKEYGEARRLLKPFVNAARPHPELDTLLSRAYAGEGRADDARDLLERAIEAFFQGSGGGRDVPTFPVWAARELYQLYAAIGESPENIKLIVQHLVRHDPERADEYRASFEALMTERKGDQSGA